jgi:hypothetical protein
LLTDWASCEMSVDELNRPCPFAHGGNWFFLGSGIVCEPRFLISGC